MPKLSAAGKQALDDLVAQISKEGKLPGFALAVSNVEEQIYANAGGKLVYGDPNSPAATLDSVFWICSMTKLLTAIAALQLIEQGKLSFDTPVSKYFPEFDDAIVLQDPFTNPNPTYKPAEHKITVLHLLSHTSGIYYGLGHEEGPIYQQPKAYRSDYDQDNKYSQFFENYKGIFPGVPLAFEPGTSFIYGFSIDVLGFIVEKTTGQSLGEYSKQHIFDPLGIENTYELTPELKECLVELCFRNPDGSISLWNERLPTIPHYPTPVNLHLGGVGSYSTLPDYLTVLRHLLQIEAGRDVPNAILKQETAKSLFDTKLTPGAAHALNAFVTPIVDPDSTDLSWSTALAVNVKDWEGRRKAGSACWSGWAGTWYFMDPTTGIALVAGSQIVPPMDNETRLLAIEAERIVYANLED